MALSPEEKQRRKEVRRLKKWNETHKIIDGVDHKICTKCETYYQSTSEFFYLNKANGIDGLSPYCKSCAVESSAKNIVENRDRRNAYMKEWMKRPVPKQRTREWVKKRREDGHYIKWQQENKDKIKGYRIDRDSNKKHNISKDEWENCKNYFNYRCAYCHLKAEEHFISYRGELKISDLHKEHVDHDGVNDLSNCVPSCKECNSEKARQPLLEWFNKDNKKFTNERLHKIKSWLEKDFKLF